MNNQSKDKQNGTVITIRKGDEYRSRVACIYQQNAFFYQSYLQAGQCVAEIVNATKQYYTVQSGRLKDPCDNVEAIQLSKFAQLASYPNNIIMFCGKRGCGKTSAMVSFAKGLELFHLKMQNNDKQAKDFWEKSGLDFGTLNQYRFIVLDSIDPTSMEQMDSILRIILSRLFDKFQTYQAESQIGNLLSYSALTQEECWKQLRTDFQQCFRALDTLKEKRNEDLYYDDLDYLAELNDSSTLKQKMMQLITDFCSLFSGRSEQDNYFLVVQIDDADLNAQHSFEIMEDIRKYMVLPKVILLLSSDLRQLEMIVEQHYVDEFRTLIDCSNSLVMQNTLPHQLGCHRSAERYINKIVPSIHQIYLPELEHKLQYADSPLYLSYLFNGKEQFKENCELQDTLLRLVYKKTHIILLKPLYAKYFFLPSTIRMLTHFLIFFHRLPDLPENISFQDLYIIEPDDNDGEARPQIVKARNLCIQNLEQVEQYFRQIWCRLRLTAKESLEMEKLFAVPFMKLNQQSMLLIQTLFENKQGNKSASNQNQATYDQVFNKLQEIKKSHDYGLDINFAIEFYYTLSMHRWLITYHVLGKTDDPFPQQSEILKFMNEGDIIDPTSFNLPPNLKNFIYRKINIGSHQESLKHLSTQTIQLINRSCIVRGTEDRIIQNFSENPQLCKNIVYSLWKLLSSDYVNTSAVFQPEDDYSNTRYLSPIQFMINLDIQNVFWDLLNSFFVTIKEKSEEISLGGFINSFIEIFNSELQKRGCPLQWDKSQFSATELNNFDQFLNTLYSKRDAKKDAN